MSPRDYLAQGRKARERFRQAIAAGVAAYCRARGITPRDLPPNEWRDLRMAAGYTQSEWAELIGAKPQTVSTWETGKATPLGVFQEQMYALAEKKR